MRMKILGFIVIFSLLLSCSNNTTNKEKKNPEPVKKQTEASANFLASGSQTLLLLMNRWIQEYTKTAPNVKITLQTGNCEIAMKMLKSDKISIAMVGREPTEQEISEGYFFVPVARDVLLPVISFDNTHIQQIVFKGISPSKLKDIFSGKIKTWGQLLNTKDNEPIEPYKIYDSSGTTVSWGNFLKLKPAEIKGNLLYNEKDVPYIVSSNKKAIGYCSSADIYDLKTGLKKRNLYIVPIDLNESNLADDNELVFDKFNDVKTTILANKYPSPPVRKIYIVTKNKPTDKNLKNFLMWVLTIGQNYCLDYGLINIDKTEANTYLEKLS